MLIISFSQTTKHNFIIHFFILQNMKFIRLIYIAIFIFSINTTIAQNKGLINNGVYIKISEGAILDINGEGASYVHNTTNGIELNGTIKTEGDLINNSSTEEIFSEFGTQANLIFDGNGSQVIGGTSATNLYDIDLQANTELQNDILISGDLQLNGAVLQVAVNELRLTETATITGSFDDNNMISTNEDGSIVKEISETGAYELPIGDGSYAPTTIDITQGTFNDAEFSINANNQKFADNNSTTDYLNVYWTINQSGITDMECDVEFNYNSNDIVGNEANIYGLHYNNTSTDLLDQTTANTITGTVTEFGTFTGGEQTQVSIMDINDNFTIAVSNNNLIIESDRELLNTEITIYSMLGRKILSQKITENYNEIALNNAVSGTYLLHINYNGVYLSKKFVLIN